MTRWLTSIWTLRIVAFTLGGIFLYAAAPKIWEPSAFAQIVYHYRIIGPDHTLPPVVANTLAVTLPWLEAVAGILLITGIWRREAAILTALMLVLFLVAVTWALANGINIENCGCFKVAGGASADGGRKAGLGLLAADTAMLAGALLLACVSPGKPAVPAETATL
jgi:putative oxidoreductase